MNGYWPWWAGAVALGSITVGYALWTGRGLGVSGAWARVASWRQCRELERLDSAFGDDAALAAAIAAATLEEFGPPPGPGQYVPGGTGDGSGGRSAGASRGQAVRTRPVHASLPVTQPRPQPLLCYAALLVSIFLGGLIGAATSGRFSLRTDMGEGFARVVTPNSVWMLVVLLAGGILVGFGTRMAGGCSSGHGLTGCSRLQPVSIVATAVFFGTAVIVSWLLWKVI